MKLKSIQIENVGCIRNLKINELHPHMNVLTGSNGVGKTTVLKSICSILNYSSKYSVKRNAQSAFGEIHGVLNQGDEAKTMSQRIEDFSPENKHYPSNFDLGRKVIWIPDSRELEYESLPFVPKDTVRDDNHYKYGIVSAGDYTKEIKGWFVNRFLFSIHSNGLTEIQRRNYETAVSAFSYLDKSVTFSRVDSRSLDILLNTTYGEIYFEYLSSGYKSLIILILGLIKEIEYRYNDVSVEDFDGFVIIDEIDLHLHPIWQTQIVESLLKVFPKVQFFISTHSPHVVQSLSPNQLIPLEVHDNNIVIRQLFVGDYGFKGWTIEEILTDVMGMSTTNSNDFHSLWCSFTNAIEADDVEQAKSHGEKLLQIMHPQNVLRKVVRLQLDSLNYD